MKKLISAVLSAAMILFAIPVADFAASSGSYVVDMRGTRTYIGLASDWSKAWSEGNFTDVTGEDVSCDGSLTIKAGAAGDVTVNGSGSVLTVTGGTMTDVQCDGSAKVSGGTMKNLQCNGSATVTGGTVYSVKADGDVKLSAVTIKHDVSSNGEFTASGSVKIGGSLDSEDITVGSGVTLNVTDDVTCSGNLVLNGGTISADAVDGNDTAVMEVKSFTGTLPVVEKMNTIRIDAGSVATSNGKLAAGRLTVADKAEFITTSTLELDTLEGPGTLSIRAGRLLIHDGIEDEPLLVFSDVVSKGTIAFKADPGAVHVDDVLLYDYSLEKKTVSDMDEFFLTNDLSEGVTLNHSSVKVEKNQPASVTAQVKPSLAKFASGTKIVWKLYGDTNSFSSAVASDSMSCSVSCTSAVSAKSRATLVAYLVDSRGDRLTNYKSDSCVVSVGSPGFTSDTTGTYSFGANNVYFYKITTTDTVAPTAVSSNSSAVPVAFSQTLSDGYLYQITNAGTGTAVITTTAADGTSVSFTAVGTGCGIVSDTPYRFSMQVGKTYQFKFMVPDADAYSFFPGDSSIIQTVSVTRTGNAYYYKIRAVAAGCTGIYGQETGKSGVRECIVTAT